MKYLQLDEQRNGIFLRLMSRANLKVLAANAKKKPTVCKTALIKPKYQSAGLADC